MKSSEGFLNNCDLTKSWIENVIFFFWKFPLAFEVLQLYSPFRGKMVVLKVAF